LSKFFRYVLAIRADKRLLEKLKEMPWSKKPLNFDMTDLDNIAKREGRDSSTIIIHI
jgi:hypothetical protein